MAQTLQSYITQVRYLLHDAQSNFYTNDQLTGYINSARERVVRDTGCLRTVQVTQAPAPPVSGGNNPVIWSSGLVVTTNQYVFSNIFIYKIVVGGTLGAEVPPYPSADYVYPPSGTLTLTDSAVTYQYVAPCEVINFAALPSGLQTLDILNVNIYWGNSRIPLRYLPWTQFNAQLRYYQNYIGRPIAFSIFGQSQIYIGPIPDQAYVAELDTVILPTTMVNLTDTDTINEPYDTVVQFYAAHLAKYYEQSFGEAEIYLQQYKQKAQSVLTSTFTRRIPDPYSTPF
jgi:hypothetical protein